MQTLCALSLSAYFILLPLEKTNNKASNINNSNVKMLIFFFLVNEN